MTPFFERLFGPSHDALVDAVNEALGESGWKVEREPIVGNVRPDIVAYEPSGVSYVIEVKEASHEANLGAVAQVETFRNAVARERGEDVKGVLIVTGEPSDDLSAVAESANVELVSAPSSKAGDVLDSLKRAGVVDSAVA